MQRRVSSGFLLDCSTKAWLIIIFQLEKQIWGDYAWNRFLRDFYFEEQRCGYVPKMPTIVKIIAELNGYWVFCLETLLNCEMCQTELRWSHKGNHLGHFRGVGRYNSHKRSNTLRFVFLRRGFLPESRLVGSKEGLFQLVGNSCLFKINLTQKHRFELIFKNLEIPAAFTLGHLLRQHNQKFKIYSAQLCLPQPLCSV